LFYGFNNHILLFTIFMKYIMHFLEIKKVRLKEN
jgi:hypothetical protein